MTAVLVVESVVIALLGLLVTGLLRSHADILRRLHELEAGAPTSASASLPAAATGSAVDIVGVTPAGAAVAVGVVGAEHDTLLAFLSSSCTTCASFWDALAGDGARQLPPRVRVVVVTRGPEAESPAAVAALAPATLPCVMTSDAIDAYGIPGLPYFVLVEGRTGRVRGEGTGVSWAQVLDLLGRADADSREARIDGELSAAGIGPGDPRLYPSSIEDAAS